MKACIITMVGGANIGNRLQNYAVQELLKNRGCDVTTLIYSGYDGEAGLSSKCKTFLSNVLEKFNILSSDLYINHIKKDGRMLITKRFNQKHIKCTKKYFFKVNSMGKHKDDFDYYCAGSDQIWNPALVQKRDFFFMKFAPREKTFSFSASMGTCYIPEKYKENYRSGFEHVGNISVRETAVKDLIKDMTGRDVPVLLDPTMLLEKNKWEAIAKCPDIDMPEKYLATYFLSDPTASQTAYIEKYAKEHGLSIIDMNHSYYDKIGPQEFIYIIANSEFVFTDSFHATVFSILFDKGFIVFQRNNMYDMSSRITTILKKFNISHRFYNVDNNHIDDTILDFIDKIKAESIETADAVIEKEKLIADSFLNNVFSKKDNI